MGIGRSLDISASILASQLRGWRGAQAFRPARKQPGKMLELYDIEASPYCRLVREALTELDLDVLIRPCPARGLRFRPQCEALGGKQQFPFLVDPNADKSMYESADIIDYLRKTYDGRVRVDQGLRRKLAIGGGYAATLVRRMRGLFARPSTAPAQPLELFSFEASPFSRLVREVLCELELPYILRNTGKGHWKDLGPPGVRDKWHKSAKDTSRNRKVLFERTGAVQVPYLIDANTGASMYESADIIRYLEKTYGG
ncbi:MAG TPA: glutathione S-transferase N-terminal domain-containing protein [Verrucomicrobiae bacterium]|nr:glutathione S-transferase N-terminal domain-containing protein [Verrucomicrobiae bacterium]